MSLYLDHFGLREPPFLITPLTEFFFSGARRGATLEALSHAILFEEGIVQVSGEVGSGKTMLCRVLMERLPAAVDTIYLANPTLAPEVLLQAIAEELGGGPQDTRPGAELRHIQEQLIARHGAGRRVVALIDEAHAMPREALEQIRLLSNLETGRHKLLQLVLLGQPELDELLARRDLRQLKDRITQHFRLDPMTPAEVTEYLSFRMRAAGYRGPDVFTARAARRIARASRGFNRRINILADKALLAAFTEGGHQVGPRQVALAEGDVTPAPLRSPWLAPLLAALAGALLLAGGWLAGRGGP
ncbi:MAG: AAA family ATPase [Rhodocyclaceae bacterium]|jgi:type II secretory pathway predicted ATPase ExeA|nr:AAA family ATPase [Rhodocyclaceae bacterium]